MVQSYNWSINWHHLFQPTLKLSQLVDKWDVSGFRKRIVAIKTNKLKQF